MGMATGILEVFGLVAAFVACDAGCKAADVTVEHFDKNKPGNADELEVPLIVAVKFRGSVDAVEAAIEAAKAAAERVTGIVSSHVITRTEEDTEAMLKLNAFDKN
ncbi:MAG: BMC domain-containing protein [Clostridia bacterium]|nr:BMC domain-containing protein [Clostridia bacterium]